MMGPVVTAQALVPWRKSAGLQKSADLSGPSICSCSAPRPVMRDARIAALLANAASQVHASLELCSDAAAIAHTS